MREKMYIVSVHHGQTTWLVLESKLKDHVCSLEKEGLAVEIREMDREKFNRMMEFAQST